MEEKMVFLIFKKKLHASIRDDVTLLYNFFDSNLYNVVHIFMHNIWLNGRWD